MSCLKPLIRAETYKSYINQKGEKSYVVEWLQRDQYDETRCEKLLISGRYRRIDKVPCGQCIECRLNYSREWATRVMLEKKYHDPNTCFFLTLTYNDEHLRFHSTVNTETGEVNTSASLEKRDLQNFWKRVRNHYPKAKIKYLNCGEYGSQTQRPHYHAVVFGLPLDISKLKKIGMNKLNQPYWSSEELTNLWGLGFVTIGEVTWESAAYVARYTLKKIKGIEPEWYKRQGKIPEYISMSQGLGKQFFDENLKEIYETDSVPVINKKTGSPVKPPRSFDRILRDIDKPLYDSIVYKRKSTGIAQEDLRQTDMSKEEERQKKKILIENSFKDIRKEL